MKRPGTTAPQVPGRGADGTTPTPPAPAPSEAPTAPSTGKRPYNRKQIPKFRNDHGSSTHHDPHSGLIVYNNHQHEPDADTLSNFCQSMLRISTLHILQSAGYDSVQANPMKVLVDCLARYMSFLAESAKEFAEHSGRSQITAFDVAHGLSDLGIDMEELKEWLTENGGAPDKSDVGTSTLANGPSTSSAPSNPNRPALPSWKGADPGRVVHGMNFIGLHTFLISIGFLCIPY